MQTIANRLLNADRNALGEIYKAANDLYSFLLQLSGVDEKEKIYGNNLALESGKAISFTWAAMCIRDFVRTKRFTDGLCAAVAAIQEEKGKQPVHILYAGTGPFAALILPLTARYHSGELQFTLLEVNDTSFDCLQNIIATLHLEKYIRRIEKADASVWTAPPGDMIDIFLSETMQQGLKTEPQVAIYMNIIPQLHPECIIIPRQVTLQAVLIDRVIRNANKRDSKTEKAIEILDTVFILNKETVLAQVAAGKREQEQFAETMVYIPPAIPGNFSELHLLTEIVVYKEEMIVLDESQLTLPLKLADLSEGRPRAIKFQYHLGTKPGMQFEFIS